VLRERERMSERLRGLGWYVEPSHANFVLTSPPPGITAAAVASGLREERILVRHFTVPGLEGSLRITVGDARATDHLLAVIAALGG